MSGEVTQFVAAKDVQRQWPQMMARAKKGEGPIGVTQGDRLIGVFLTADEYESMRGTALKRLLKQRIAAGGPTYSSDEVLRFVKKRLQSRRTGKQ